MEATSVPASLDLPAILALAAPDMAAVDALIRRRLGSDVVLVNQVAEHIVSGGGKRLRPMLLLLAARALGHQGGDAQQLAAVVEFIHTATLLHDDVVDESDLRRGRKTANAVFGNAASVLVGDFLYSRSFQLMVEPGNMRTLEILANASATIAEGEVLQLSAAMNIATTEDTYLQVIRGKTAALFEAACEVGGVIANRPEAEVRALATYGDGLGIAFQMADDLLDWGGSDGVIGKNTGDDFRERKLTLPVIRAIARADDTERAFWQRTIEKGDQQEGDLDHALALLRRHGTLDETRSEAFGWSARAQEALTVLPDHPLRDMMHDLADYVVARLA